MARAFSEDSRVKIPALLHFTRLGYQYRRLKDIRTQLDFETNINRQVLRDAMNKLNPPLLASPLTDEEFQLLWRNLLTAWLVMTWDKLSLEGCSRG